MNNESQGTGGADEGRKKGSVRGVHVLNTNFSGRKKIKQTFQKKKNAVFPT